MWVFQMDCDKVGTSQIFDSWVAIRNDLSVIQEIIFLDGFIPQLILNGEYFSYVLLRLVPK